MTMKRAKKRAGTARTSSTRKRATMSGVKSRPSPKRVSTKRASAKRASTKRASTKRASTKRASTKRASTKRASTKRASTKRGNRYGASVGKTVESAMHRRKKGTLKSRSGQKVTSRKQAIAIGLSEARREGGKVPRKKSSSGTKKK